jgi:hypothetical protein
MNTANASSRNDRPSADTHPVMPAKAGIHGLPSSQQRKSWMPAFAGMTGWAQPRRVNLYVGWHKVVAPQPSDRRSSSICVHPFLSAFICVPLPSFAPIRAGRPP